MSGEPLSEILTANTIIIHPGSLYLRLGRGSDSRPVRLLHAIARRRKEKGKRYRDQLLVPQVKLDSNSEAALEHSTNQVFDALSQVSKSDNNKRKPVAREKVSQKNTEALSDAVINEDDQVIKVVPEEEVIVGDEILDLPNTPQYNIHFPFRRGDVNLHPDIGGSLTSILKDLEEIWTRSIERHLGVQVADMRQYKAVLVIPALYKRSLVKHFVSLLLLNIGFGGCFVVQDHVAATFGSGLAAACVVDVGDQKVSVSCVEDGVSQPNTRLQLGYGGSDVTQALARLVLGPRRSLGLGYRGQERLRRMKEALGHLDLDTCSLDTYDLATGENQSVRLTVGDEALVAALGYFQPSLLEATGRKSVAVMGRDVVGDPEDPHDHLYLRDTSRKYTRTGDPREGAEARETGTEAGAEYEAETDLETLTGPDVNNGDSPLPLDQAILRSVEMLGSEDARRKLLASVLVVGGGLAFRGAGAYLQSRLGPGAEVITSPRDTPGDSVVWRGAAIMAGLETAQELWIRPREWSRSGQKLLRERAPFPWA